MGRERRLRCGGPSRSACLTARAALRRRTAAGSACWDRGGLRFHAANGNRWTPVRPVSPNNRHPAPCRRQAVACNSKRFGRCHDCKAGQGLAARSRRPWPGGQAADGGACAPVTLRSNRAERRADECAGQSRSRARPARRPGVAENRPSFPGHGPPGRRFRPSGRIQEDSDGSCESREPRGCPPRPAIPGAAEPRRVRSACCPGRGGIRPRRRSFRPCP
jgi:hypothetical protein